jgi:hypothetical protein
MGQTKTSLSKNGYCYLREVCCEAPRTSWNFWLKQVDHHYEHYSLLLTDLTDDGIDGFVSWLEKVSPALVALILPAVEEVKRTVQYANAVGVSGKIFFRPLMLGSHHSHLKDGVLVEVVRRGKRLDVLTAGGR